jgi:tRNA 2-thiouridine synthesizing protein E
MGYVVDGVELETDDDGYLLEANYGDEIVNVIAEAEGIALTENHWKVVQYMREQFREHGHTPNYRTMLKDMEEVLPDVDSKQLYDMFPLGPAKQGARLAGLPKPFGKGGY